MIELLKLCGFKEQEIKSEFPRVEKVFGRLEITAEDVERGKQRLTKYYDMELVGVRKALRLCVRELLNIVLAREEGKKKVIYGFMSPGGIDVIGAAAVSKSKEVLSVHQSWAFQIVLGCIFGKIVPLLEAAEGKWLKAGAVAHCGNVKTLLGLISSDLVPKPDLLVSCGYLCDTAPKTLDLIHELYNIPVCSFDICQDRESREYPEATKRTLDLAMKSMRRLTERVQEVVGFEITDDMLWEILNVRGRFVNAVRKLRGIIESGDPLPISATHENLLMALSSLNLGLDSLPEAIDAVNTLCEEVQERVASGIGFLEKGAPRVLAMFPPGAADPRLDHLVGELGIAIVATDVGRSLSLGGSSKDPHWTIAMGLQQSSLRTISARRVPMILEACKTLHVEGLLGRFHAGCRAVAGDALIIADAIERELGIPVLLLEWENFDPRAYYHEEFKKKLGVFKTMMLTRRSS